MALPLTLRLDEETRRCLARMARRKRVSTSEVIRQAIKAWMRGQELISSPYEAVADLIGVVHGGKPMRSRETVRRFTKLLKSRRSRH